MLRTLLILGFLLLSSTVVDAQEPENIGPDVGDWIVRKGKSYLVVATTETGVTVWNYWRDKNEKLNYNFSKWEEVIKGRSAGVLALRDNSIVQLGTKLNLKYWSDRRGIYHVYWRYHAKYGWLAYFGEEWIYIAGH